MTKSACLIPPLTVLAATLAFATPSLAQQARPGEQLGMRYLTWAGKPAGPSNDGLRRPADFAPRAQTASLSPAVAAVGRPNRYGAAMSGAQSGAQPAANGPTPASAWIGAPSARSLTQAEQPRPMPQAPAPQPQAVAMPEPIRTPAAAPADAQMTASAPAYDTSRALRRQDPYYGAPPQVQMAMQPTPQPVPLPPPPMVPTAIEPAAAALADAAPADPMAPRRDAMIFRMNRPDDAAQLAPQGQPAQAAPRQLAQAAPTRPGGPPRDSARYYSVHREAGHEPDPMILPESVFIGGASADLAEPPPALTMPRTVNGRTQVVVPNQDPTLP